MKYPFGKMAWREIKTRPGRYLAILAIVALGVGFYAGLFVIEDAMLDTTNSYITEYNLYDFSVSSTLGLYEDDVKQLARIKGVNRAEGVIAADAVCRTSAGAEQVLHFMSIPKHIALPEVVAGRLPKDADECLADSNRYTEEDLGKKIKLQDADTDTFAYTEFTIVGIGRSVEYLNYQRGNTDLGGGSINSFCYIPRDGFATEYFTAVHIKADTDAYVYSDEYDALIKALKIAVTDKLEALAEQRGILLIEQAHAKIADGVAAYEQGKIDLMTARAEAEKQFAEAEAEIAQGYEQIAAGKAEIAELQAKLEIALPKAKADFDAAMAEAAALVARADAIANEVDYDKYLEVTDALSQLEEARVNLLRLLKEDPENEQYADLLARVEQKKQDITDEYAPLLATMSHYHDLRTKAQEIRDSAQEAFDNLDLAAKGLIAMQLMEINDAESELNIAQKKIMAERIKLNKEFDQAEKDLEQALGELKLPDDLSALTNPSTFVLTREQNRGYASMEADSTIISGVVVVFPVFFVLVAALVCSTVMTRMVEDERTSLGTLKALGYGKRALMAKYLIYAGSASLIGSILGFFIGTFAMPRVLWMAYILMYDFTDTLQYVFNPTLLAACVAIALACCMGTATLCVLGEAKQVPAQLMRPRTGISGKRLFFERITFLWKPLPFLTKVALRNIWRYKKRLLVMVLGIGGSTALLVTGFGIANSIKPLADYQFENISLYDYEITFKDEMDADKIAAFTERNADKLGYIMTMHQSEQSVESEHGSHTATLHVSDSLEGYIALSLDGQPVPFPDTGEAVINQRLADVLRVSIGDGVTLQTDHGQIHATVSGIVDNYIGNVTYISTQTYQSETGKAPVIKTALVYAPEGAELDRTAAQLRGDEDVVFLEAGADTQDMLRNMMQSMNYVVIVVIICAGALAYIVLFNLTNINITERTREIATLRVIGLYRGETRRYVMAENYVLSVVGALVGLPAGVLLHRYVMSKIVLDAISFPVTIFWQSYLYSFLLTVLFAVLVGLALRRRIDRISMAESLKSVE